MADLRKAIRNGGRDKIQGYGDMSLTEMLPALLTSYNETEMLVAAPAIPDQAAEIIETWMRWQWARVDGKGKINVLTHLTIVADLSEDMSPKASQWLKENPFCDRLTLINKAQDDTALLLPDIAITGPLNLRYGQNFVCDVTTIPEQVRNLWERYIAAAKEKPAQQEAKPVRKSAKKRKPSSAGKSKQ